jgi:hypothetical protein
MERTGKGYGLRKNSLIVEIPNKHANLAEI